MTTFKAKLDLFANFVGRGWMALLAILVIPLYVNFLGIESYGLIGFYSGLCAFFSIADFGIGETFCREIARLSSNDEKIQTTESALRTLEILYWALGALLSLVIILLSPWICENWLQDHRAFDPDRLCYILRLIGASFFFLWPQIFYSKGLLGLKAHLLNNTILVFGTTVRYMGSLAIIWFQPTLEAFFYWQIFSGFLQTLLALVFVWKKLAMQRIKMRFSLKSFPGIWKFGIGMGAIGITSSILMQIDKFFVSHFFSLETLGYYCFSYTVASSLYYLAQPIALYYYPLFIDSVQKKELYSLKKLYQSANKHILLIVSPLAFLLLIFGKQIILLWTSNAVMAEKCTPLIALMALGIFVNCVMSINFYLQFASGNTRAIFSQNLFFILFMTPICCLLGKFFGPLGVACFYILLNLGYLVFNLPQSRQILMQSE